MSSGKLRPLSYYTETTITIQLMRTAQAKSGQYEEAARNLNEQYS